MLDCNGSVPFHFPKLCTMLGKFPSKSFTEARGHVSERSCWFFVRYFLISCIKITTLFVVFDVNW